MRFYFYIFLVLLAYLFSFADDPILGDGLVFTVQAYNSFEFSTNATNHFLYVNFLAFCHHIIPSVNPHYLFISISILFSIGTLIQLKKLLRFFHLSDKIADILVLLFALSFTFWRTSIITEVYAFYLFFCLLFLNYSFDYIINDKNKSFIKASFLLGILFLIHIQSILFLPFYGLLIFKNYKRNTLSVLYGIIIFLFIVSVLLIPVLLDKHNALAILNDNKYEDSIFNFQFSVLAKALIRNLGFLIYNFWGFLVFAVWGFRQVEYKKYLLCIVIPFIVFILKHNVTDSYVFHLVPSIFLLVVIGKGIEKKLPKMRTIVVLAIPLFYYSTYKLIEMSSIGEKMNTETGFKGGAKYFFFPPLHGNPNLDVFVKVYEQKQLKNIETFDYQYHFAKKWIEIRKKYK